ncbi:MAG: glycosyltransferase family 4 protein [Acidobacteriaceae bacterium]
MSSGAALREKPRVLVLLMEPTPYIIPRALYLRQDSELAVDLYFVTANSSQPWGEDVSDEELPVLLNAALSPVQRLKNAAAVLGRVLRKKYSAVHLAGWGHWITRLAILACRIRRVPFSVESDTPLGAGVTGWRRSIKDWVYPFWMKWITVAIPGGRRQAEYFRRYGVPDDRIVISHMTVDTEAIREMKSVGSEEFRRANGVPSNMVVFLFVGRLLVLKGIDTLLAAFEKAAAEDHGIGLVIVGDGPERAKVEEARARLPRNIWAVGRQNYSRVISWMRSSDVFVLPSRNENWGLVVNEAMVCGLPVVISDVCGCVEDLVFEGQNGHIFPVNDVEKLTETMLSIARCGEARCAMGRASATIIEPWTALREAEIFRSTLRQVVSGV